MALDLHAARSKHGANRQRLHLAFDEIAHGQIFDRMFRDENLKRRFSLLARLSDYYADASFHSQELDALSSEVSAATEEYPDEPAHAFLLSFAKLCLDAKNGGLNLYAFCD